ncbi:30S ribosomal protein S1 [Paenibacillus ginsengarvi]|uniref:30S ribosomal protein S1 n=1 Tax=Paenibacillus ginsengarvi TaxID=400777 RepID=A0A3B0CJU3_9BACL|nr:30S ribosomal protein S1 [Paenibacillus ginsengarvi]RKN84607.1 30S ribosomal protein S1 [Paenibacillus ginsengarvi]
MSEEINVQESAEAANQELLSVATYKKGDIVKGKIVKIEDNQAIVDIGYKYDGIIPLKELSSVSVDNAAEAVQVGQEVELKVLSLDDNKEKLLLSKRAVDNELSWNELQAKLEQGTIIEAQVKEVVKGGLVVDVGLRGFVPASMVERHFVEDFSDYKGRTLRLKVKELDREKNKVVLSQKDVLDEEFEANKKQVMSNLTVGQQLDGTVQRLTQFGAFVDIGGIDGLVHISEMAWHHVEKPSDVVAEGDKVQVQVLKVDPEHDRISLSIRATQPGPWQQAAGSFQIGEIVKGEVKRLVNFGAFVEIAPGVEGLVHISQIAHRHIGTPHEVLKEGQEVSVKILDFNPAEKRVSLSIKETEEAPEAPAKPERERRNDRGGSRGSNHNEPIPPRESLNMTLGERFGDKLSKFK